MIELPEQRFNLDRNMEEIAASIAKKATRDDTSLQETIDAFKALTTYYAAKRRHGNHDPDEPEGGTFTDFARDIGGQDGRDTAAPVRSSNGRAG